MSSRSSGAALVRIALLAYGALLAVAVGWAVLAGESLLYASADAERRGVDPWLDPAAGLAAGGLAVLVSRELTRRTRSGERLARALGELLGPLSTGRCAVLALASGLAEEAFFRGMLQPRLGLVATSALFGAAHFAPRRDLAPWTLSSVAAGFLLGALFEATGNLVAPVVAHVAINALNLRWLARRYGGGAGG